MAANAKVTSNPGTCFSSSGVSAGDTEGKGVSMGVSVGISVAVEVANFSFHAFIYFWVF